MRRQQLSIRMAPPISRYPPPGGIPKKGGQFSINCYVCICRNKMVPRVCNLKTWLAASIHPC